MTAPQQQKLKVKGPVVITGNRLGDGAVVYRTATRGWSTSLSEAIVTTTADEATRLLKDANASDIEAVGAYVAPVILEGDDIRPGNLRERIRVAGPTFALPGSEAA
jgi:predicted NAD/FAD-binding protein